MKRLEGEKYCTVSWVPTMISFLRKRLGDAMDAHPYLNNDEESNDDVSKNEEDLVIEDVLPHLLMKLNKDFEERFGNGDDRQFDAVVIRGFLNRQIGIHPTIVIASVLDPRFKSLSCFWMQEDKDAIWNALLAEMKSYLSGKDLEQFQK